MIFEELDFIHEVPETEIKKNVIKGKSAVVLLSGGMDSTAAVMKAIQDGCVNINCLQMQYGSTHNERELESAYDVVEWYNSMSELNAVVNFEVVELNEGIFAGKGALTNAEETIPDSEYAATGEQTTVVPFRNANLISAAVAYAESFGFDFVYVANHASDANEFAYPDCTFEFMGAMAAAVRIGTMGRVALVTPFQFMTKSDIVSYGHWLNVPFRFTYSCYRGGEIHCGTCPTCVERKQAFELAGVEDPTVYEGY